MPISRFLSIFILVFTGFALAVSCAKSSPAPTPNGPVDGYVAVAPGVFRAGGTETISVSLLSRGRPTSGTVRASLLKDGATLASATSQVDAHGDIALAVPAELLGRYDLVLSAPGFSDVAQVQVQSGTIVFLETDKPIYKPGHTVHMRTLTLDPELKPLEGRSVTVEVQDAKGTKVFRQEAATDDYGMVTLDLPLSTEPNMGVWKVTALADGQRAETDIRVEEYVLPKYEVSVDLPREWILASEPVTGTAAAEYTFGKPVTGTLTVKALRYVGAWEEYATLSKDIDGSTTFQVRAPGYVAGVPGARGMGNVQLEITVEEQATGYKETITRLITVAQTPVSLQVIPESRTFKPGLPLDLLIVTETPDNAPLDREVDVTIIYMNKDLEEMRRTSHRASTRRGKAVLEVTPPSGSVALSLEAESAPAHAALAMEAAYSPSGGFVHVEQTSDGDAAVGERLTFRVHATREATRFYYEVIARGRVVFTGMTASRDISFTATPVMAPEARLLVYQVLPNSEVAADYLPFSVEGDYPHQVQAAFTEGTVRPGDPVGIDLQTQGAAKVGLVAVDRSVFILAENRLNLQRVFAELERLYGEPRVELHEVRQWYEDVIAPGAKETFKDAGVVVLSNQSVPEGTTYENRTKLLMDRAVALEAAGVAGAPPPQATPSPGDGGLAEVQRVRQFFPETWLWMDVLTGRDGKATVRVEAPDSITTWVLRAVGLSKEHGLGVGEAELRVFQPFFLSADLPYSAIRGEELPVRVALYNYLDTAQEIVVDLEEGEGFALLDSARKTVRVAPNEVGAVSFMISPTQLGRVPVKVTARSAQAADAVVRELLIEPEGVAREIVDNIVLSPGSTHEIDTRLPANVVPGSGRASVALTGSYLTQTIEGLEGLLQMPFGCGEQNMILFAPNVFVARYLETTGQIKPEIMAKAQNLMLTGYQRELTYRRDDGSFSAFGEQDDEGSLWLTAFVLKTFAQAKGLIYVDQAVLDDAAAWIVRHQRSNGSFAPVGFLHHQELLGGLQGNDALTAYTAIALMESGETTASAKAVRYLEGRLDGMEDAYATAITAYALSLANSPRAGDAYDKLMAMAKEDGDGLHWGEEVIPLPSPVMDGFGAEGPGGPRPIDIPSQPQAQSAAIETTGYATLALLEQGDRFNASRAARWLVTRRNAFGGFGSTQDTVVGLQALIGFSTASLANVDLTVTLSTPDGWHREVRITPQNADVLQTLEVPTGTIVTVQSSGTGEAVLQGVRRFNVPEAVTTAEDIFNIAVDYGTDHVAVNDLIDVVARIRFTPTVQNVEAGMVVLDVAVPTGFEPVRESLNALVASDPKLKRYDVAGRKVIIYIENMRPGDEVTVQFQARALYPVRAESVTSTAYSYYNPSWNGETLGGAMVVTER